MLWRPIAEPRSFAGECVETGGYRPADDRCKIVPGYTSFLEAS